MPVNNFDSCGWTSLGPPTQFGTNHIGLQKDIFADGMNLKRPEPEGIAPVEAAALHDGVAGAHQAWREKEGN
jgi:hypothetical protein